MTAQISDVLSYHSEHVALDGLGLYGVIQGDIHSNHGWGDCYQFERQPNPPKEAWCTALWRGFVSNYELRSNGELFLVSYTYPFTKLEDEHFEEQVKGDFWLVMKPDFYSKRVYIPFVDSKIVMAE